MVHERLKCSGVRVGSYISSDHVLSGKEQRKLIGKLLERAAIANLLSHVSVDRLRPLLKDYLVAFVPKPLALNPEYNKFPVLRK